MSAGLEDIIAFVELRYFEIGRHLNYASGSLNAAGNALAAHNYGSAGYFLTKAAGYITDTANDFYSATYGLWKWDIWLWRWVDTNWPENGELTAIAICEAWAKNGFEDRALTIAFIDRMRQLIWDEPFYVKWASRPEDAGD